LPTLPIPKAGEVWDVRLDPTIRPAQAGTRPVIVISTDWFNEAGSYLVVVVPVTRTDRGIEYQLKLTRTEGGLARNSVVLCEQVRSVSVLRFLGKRGEISVETLATVQRMVGRIIGAQRLFRQSA
jgi:mRNA interferase MazF